MPGNRPIEVTVKTVDEPIALKASVSSNIFLVVLIFANVTIEKVSFYLILTNFRA